MIYINIVLIFFVSGCCPSAPDSPYVPKSISKEKFYNDKTAEAPEMEPLTEQASNEDAGSVGVDSWLETSSKYHSCELVDTDDEMKHG